jgi:predicted alternative tryptophan synthase beta-subunit
MLFTAVENAYRKKEKKIEHVYIERVKDWRSTICNAELQFFIACFVDLWRLLRRLYKQKKMRRSWTSSSLPRV